MAEKGFGVKEINLIGASGTPTIESPNNLNLNAVNVAISTNATIGGNLTVTGTVGIAGTLTYEDVTNIDAIGIVTARTGLKVLAGGANVVGVVTATSFTGSGANLTSLPAGNLTGTLPAISGANLTNLDASDLASGTIPDARFPSTLPAVSGANLTGIAVTEAPAVDYTITANGASAYRFHGGGVDETANNPTLYLIRGQKYRFNNTTGSSHPFALRVSNGGSAYTDGVTGSQNGIQFFTVPYAAPASLVYQCTIHSGMVGSIVIRGGASTANISNNADNRVITGGSGGNLNGEANLIFTGTRLGLNNTSPTPLNGDGTGMISVAGGNPEVVLVRTTSGTEAKASIRVTDGEDFKIAVKDGSGSTIDAFAIDTGTGNIDIAETPSSGGGVLNIKTSSAGTFFKFRNAADFDNNLEGTALDSRNSANNASKDLLVRSQTLVLWQGSTEKLRIGSAGQLGIGGANYGTAGQVLTSTGNSTGLSWATPSGGMTLLASATLSSSGTTAANISFNTTGYEYLYGKLYSVTRPSGNINDLGLRWNGTSSTVYDFIMQRMDGGGTGSERYVQGASQFYYNMQGVAGWTSGRNQAVFELHLVNDGVRKPFNMKHSGELSGNPLVLTTDGMFDVTSSITSLEITTYDTDINGGTLKLYGVK